MKNGGAIAATDTHYWVSDGFKRIFFSKIQTYVCTATTNSNKATHKKTLFTVFNLLSTNFSTLQLFSFQG